MATVEETLKSVLTGVTVYPDFVPADGSYPCCVYQEISVKQIRSHSANELQRPRFQLTCWGKNKEDAISTSRTVRNILDLNKTNFMLCTLEDERDRDDVEAKLFGRQMDFFIFNNIN